MKEAAHQQGQKEEEENCFDQELYEQCLKKAEGNEMRAKVYYRHRLKADLEPKSEDLDKREKWPMLTPLLILYTLGTIGVLALVYGFLANRLGWW
jgi:hypothetical protein